MNQHLEQLFGIPPPLTAEEFEQVFHTHYDKIVATAYQLTADADEAEDLAAETFWQLWIRPPRSRDNLTGWLYRVVINRGYNRFRSNHRRSSHELTNHRMETMSGSNPAGDGSPEAQLIHNQAITEIRTILRRLPLRDAQILLMRANGLSYREIATSLRVPPGNVGTWIARAERKFITMFERGEQDASKR